MSGREFKSVLFFSTGFYHPVFLSDDVAVRNPNGRPSGAAVYIPDTGQRNTCIQTSNFNTYVYIGTTAYIFTHSDIILSPFVPIFSTRHIHIVLQNRNVCIVFLVCCTGTRGQHVKFAVPVP